MLSYCQFVHISEINRKVTLQQHWSNFDTINLISTVFLLHIETLRYLQNMHIKCFHIVMLFIFCICFFMNTYRNDPLKWLSNDTDITNIIPTHYSLIIKISISATWFAFILFIFHIVKCLTDTANKPHLIPV